MTAEQLRSLMNWIDATHSTKRYDDGHSHAYERQMRDEMFNAFGFEDDGVGLPKEPVVLTGDRP